MEQSRQQSEAMISQMKTQTEEFQRIVQELKDDADERRY